MVFAGERTMDCPAAGSFTNESQYQRY